MTLLPKRSFCSFLRFIVFLVLLPLSCNKDEDSLRDAVFKEEPVSISETEGTETKDKDAENTDTEDTEVDLDESSEDTIEEIAEDSTAGFELEARTVRFPTVQDAYLQKGEGFNRQIVRLSENLRTSYLMFDLSPVDSVGGIITSVDLEFVVATDDGYGEIKVFKGVDNNWREEQLSDKSAPAIEIPLGSLEQEYNINSKISIGLNPKALFPEVTTLILDHSNGDDFAFASKENETVQGAHLVVAYEAPIGSEEISIETSQVLNENVEGDEVEDGNSEEEEEDVTGQETDREDEESVATEATEGEETDDAQEDVESEVTEETVEEDAAPEANVETEEDVDEEEEVADEITAPEANEETEEDVDEEGETTDEKTAEGNEESVVTGETQEEEDVNDIESIEQEASDSEATDQDSTEEAGDEDQPASEKSENNVESNDEQQVSEESATKEETPEDNASQDSERDANEEEQAASEEPDSTGENNDDEQPASEEQNSTDEETADEDSTQNSSDAAGDNQQAASEESDSTGENNDDEQAASEQQNSTDEEPADEDSSQGTTDETGDNNQPTSEENQEYNSEQEAEEEQTTGSEPTGSNEPTEEAPAAPIPPSNSPPITVISATPSSGTAPLSVTFRGADSSDDKAVVAYSWNFTAGATATTAEAEYTFERAGSYEISLETADEEGLRSTETVTITVDEPQNQAPSAVAQASVLSGEAPLTVDFRGSDSSDENGIVNYDWNILGKASSEPDTSHTFENAGVYDVTLTVTDDKGLTDTASLEITVTEKAVVAKGQIPCDNGGGQANATGRKVWCWQDVDVPQYSGEKGIVFNNRELGIDSECYEQQVTRSGNRLKFSVDPTTPDAASWCSTDFNIRAELRTALWDVRHAPGTEEWFGWSYTFGNDYQPDENSQWKFFQVHNGVRGTPPQIGLEVVHDNQFRGHQGGEIFVVNECHSTQGRAADYSPTGINPRAGQTVDVVVHVIWENASRGLLQVWLNGNKVYDKQVSTLLPGTNHAGNAKWGIYKWPWKNADAVEKSRQQGITRLETYMGPLRIITRKPGDPEYGTDSYTEVAPN